MYYNQKDGCNLDGITTEFCHFFSLAADIWASLYDLEDNKLLTTK